MTIAEVRDKCKSLVGQAPKDMLVLGVLLLASLASFGLGYLAGVDAGRGGNTADQAILTEIGSTTGTIVASKTGTKYYLPECAGAARISEENKVWFVSAVAAVAAGYSPAANCSGL